MTNERLKQATEAIDTLIKRDFPDFGYLVFLVDFKADVNTGTHSDNLDIGDALVAIQRIVMEFEISPAALIRTLLGGGE